ncbi:MAG: hypothetical protein HC880_05885 [Bacteroidia bacterium]|nr:hypothetical protein [Bacteroidia bacterium]
MNQLHRYFFFMILGLVVLSSCDEELDLTPQQSVSSDVALSTSDGVKATLIGVYGVVRGICALRRRYCDEWRFPGR